MKNLILASLIFASFTSFADIFGETSKIVISVEKLPQDMLSFKLCERQEGNVLITNPEKFETTLVNCQVLGKGDYSLEKVKKLRTNKILWSIGTGAIQGLIVMPLSIFEIAIYGAPIMTGIPHLILGAVVRQELRKQYLLRNAVLNDDKIILKYSDESMNGIAIRLNNLLNEIK